MTIKPKRTAKLAAKSPEKAAHIRDIAATIPTAFKKSAPQSTAKSAPKKSAKRRLQPADLPPVEVYELRVRLVAVKPLVWRRLRVRGDIPLSLLHCVLQTAIGWTNSHLHHFFVGKQRYAELGADSEFEPDESTMDTADVTLQTVCPKKGSALGYEYDFGDSWLHEVVVEKILPPETPMPHWAVLVDGAGTCPPEDCGGPYGFNTFLPAYLDPKHPQHRDMVDWIGEYNPEAFDCAAWNDYLRELRWPKTTQNQLGRILMSRDGYTE